MKTIIAMGGGYSGEARGTFQSELPKGQEFYENSTRDVDRLIISAATKKPTILLITTASEDGKHHLEHYRYALTEQFKGLGAHVDSLSILTDKPSKDEIHAKIEEANVIYVTGGNSDLMMETWRKHEVDKLLLQAYENGIVMSGLSAGASCWFKYICSNSYYTGKPIEVEALGWIEAFVCPHYDSEPFRQEALKQMLKERPGMVGVGLDEYAAVEIIDEEFRTHSYWSGGKVRKCFWSKDEYRIEEIDTAAQFISLDELIQTEDL